MFVLNISIRLYTGISQATNQIDLQTSFNKYPVLVAILAIIIAPFTEELLFRNIKCGIILV